MHRTLVASLARFCGNFAWFACVVCPVASFAQVPDMCRDVLELTGREKRMVYSNEILRQFLSYMQEKRGSTELGIKLVEVLSLQFGNSSNETIRKESLNEAQKMYLEVVESVFGPAVAAWTACMKGMGEGMRVKTSFNAVRNVLSVDFKKGTGKYPVLLGVMPDTGVSCVGTTVAGQKQVVLRSSMSFKLPDRVWTMTCRREGHADKKSIRVSMSDESYDFVMPAIPGPLVKYNEATAVGEPFTGTCGHVHWLRPQNYPREVRVSAQARVSTKDAPRRGWYTVRVNRSGGVINEKIWDNANNSTYVPEKVSDTILIGAYEPILIETDGGSHKGSDCFEVSGAVRYNKPEVAPVPAKKGRK